MSIECQLIDNGLLNPKVYSMIYETIIIGAGPAGLFAAINLQRKPVLLLEKKPSPGLKLLISGSGRCNFTHAGNLRNFLHHYGDHSRFLKPALYGFTNRDLVDFFLERGLPAEEDKNGKLFPATQNARDVLALLLNELSAKHVSLHCDEPVKSVRNQDGLFTVTTLKNEYYGRNLLIATGGLSYPSTGSSGDGYVFAGDLGHSIVTTVPALSPVYVLSYRMTGIAGNSLTGRQISLYRNNRKIAENRGDIGFTHHGLSGPGILDFSRKMQAGDVLRINLLNMPPDDFRKMLIREAGQSGKTMLKTLLKEFDLSRNLIQLLLEEAGTDPEVTLSNITKDLRIRLVEIFCNYPFTIERVGGFKVAMVTAGGVDLSEVDPHSMESKLIPGLYFAGEVLDIDGDTGGYNIQAAFSTAFLATRSINEKHPL